MFRMFALASVSVFLVGCIEVPDPTKDVRDVRRINVICIDGVYYWSMNLGTNMQTMSPRIDKNTGHFVNCSGNPINTNTF